MALASPAMIKEKGCTMHSLGGGLFQWVQGPLDAESGAFSTPLLDQGGREAGCVRARFVQSPKLGQARSQDAPGRR